MSVFHNTGQDKDSRWWCKLYEKFRSGRTEYVGGAFSCQTEAAAISKAYAYRAEVEAKR